MANDLYVYNHTRGYHRYRSESVCHDRYQTRNGRTACSWRLGYDHCLDPTVYRFNIDRVGRILGISALLAWRDAECDYRCSGGLEIEICLLIIRASPQ